jgi:hypothetical protein
MTGRIGAKPRCPYVDPLLQMARISRGSQMMVWQPRRLGNAVKLPGPRVIGGPARLAITLRTAGIYTAKRAIFLVCS